MLVLLVVTLHVFHEIQHGWIRSREWMRERVRLKDGLWRMEEHTNAHTHAHALPPEKQAHTNSPNVPGSHHVTLPPLGPSALTENTVPFQWWKDGHMYKKTQENRPPTTHSKLPDTVQKERTRSVLAAWAIQPAKEIVWFQVTAVVCLQAWANYG